MSRITKAVETNPQMAQLESALNKVAASQNEEANEKSMDDIIEDKCKEVLSKNLCDNIINLNPIYIEVGDNCRKTTDTESVSFFQLLSSIKKEGILQNIVIEIRENPWKFVCIAGQRRLLAAKELKLSKIPCLVKSHHSKEKSILKSLDENIHRENLMPIELAEAYVVLEKGGLTASEIADRYDKSKKTIERYLKIGKFPKVARDIIRQNPDIFIVSVLFSNFSQIKFNNDEEIINAIKEKLMPTNKNADKKNDDLKFSDFINKKIGLKTSIKESGNEGKVTIYYKNEDEKNKLINVLQKID